MNVAVTLITVEVFLKILETVEVAEHKSRICRDVAASVLQLIDIL